MHANRHRWLWCDVVLPFVLTRLGLLLVGLLAVSLGAMHREGWHVSNWRLIDIWARWDSKYYLSIAVEGYHYVANTQSSVAFFPLYPLLMRLLSLGTQNRPLLAVVGWLISNTAALLALALLYRLVLLDWDAAVARRTVWLLITFPLSFYFSVVYSESLFLLLTVTAFYCVRRDGWLAGGLLGGLSAATRSIGVFLILPLLVEWLQQPNRRWRSALPLLLIPCGLLAYMVYLQVTFGDPLLFLKAQAVWNRAVSPAGLMENLSGIAQAPGTTLREMVGDLPFALLGLVLLISVWRRQRLSYRLFAFSAFSIPLATLNLMSLARFLVVIFPFFIAMALWLARPWWFRLAVAAFAIAQMALFAAWSLWYWIA